MDCKKVRPRREGLDLECGGNPEDIRGTPLWDGAERREQITRWKSAIAAALCRRTPKVRPVILPQAG
jgi:hypothetical protein